MAEHLPIAGAVEWSGENPGMYLKTDPNGPFVTLVSFFRVMLSPHGRGHALVLMQSPADRNPPADRGNICLYDNEPLARYLINDYVSNFGPFKGTPGLAGLQYRKLDSVETSGDSTTTYVETVKAGDLTVRLAWGGLGKPFCFVLPVDKSATGKHYMPSLFVGSSSPTATVNGRVLPGKPIAREIAGQTITTAMLAFAETWVRA